MNISMTYDMLPDYTASRDAVKPATYFPVTTRKSVSSTDSQDITSRNRASYKYYVLKTQDDRLYTRARTVETLYHHTLGSLVDVYA